jgi:hypothetical protein
VSRTCNLLELVVGASLLATVSTAFADECVIIFPGGWPQTSNGLPIALVGSASGVVSGPGHRCVSLQQQQSVAAQSAIQGVVISGNGSGSSSDPNHNGGDPVDDGRDGCKSTLALQTTNPRAELPFATLEESPHDINTRLGLVVSQWNQNWALQSWNAVQVKGFNGASFNPLTVRLSRAESVNAFDGRKVTYSTNLDVLNQFGSVIRTLTNIDTSQLLQIGIGTSVNNSGTKQLKLFVGANDVSPTIVIVPSTTVLTLSYGVNAQIAADATSGASGWVSFYPCNGTVTE